MSIGYPDWTIPNANAAAIAAAGVPLLGKPVQLVNVPNQTITTATPYSTGIIACGNYLSYNLTMTAYCGSQGTALAPLQSQVLVQFFADAAGTVELFRERWWGWLGNAAGAAEPMHGTGPVHAPYMQVQVINFNSAGVNVTMPLFALWGTSRPVSRSRWVQGMPSGITSGITTLTTLGGYPADDGVLLEIDNLPTAINNTYWMPIPLWPGTVYIRYGGAILAKNWFIAEARNLLNSNVLAGGNAQGILVFQNSTAATELEATIVAPQAPLYTVWNTDATHTPSIALTLTGQAY